MLRLDDPEHVFYFALGLLALGLKDEAKTHLPRLQELAPELADELQGYLDEEE